MLRGMKSDPTSIAYLSSTVLVWSTTARPRPSTRPLDSPFRPPRSIHIVWYHVPTYRHTHLPYFHTSHVASTYTRHPRTTVLGSTEQALAGDSILHLDIPLHRTIFRRTARITTTLQRKLYLHPTQHIAFVAISRVRKRLPRSLPSWLLPSKGQRVTSCVSPASAIGHLHAHSIIPCDTVLTCSLQNSYRPHLSTQPDDTAASSLHQYEIHTNLRTYLTHIHSTREDPVHDI